MKLTSRGSFCKHKGSSQPTRRATRIGSSRRTSCVRLAGHAPDVDPQLSQWYIGQIQFILKSLYSLLKNPKKSQAAPDSVPEVPDLKMRAEFLVLIVFSQEIKAEGNHDMLGAFKH